MDGGVEGPARLSTSDRSAVLAVLDECRDALVIFQYSLEKQSKRSTDTGVPDPRADTQPNRDLLEREKTRDERFLYVREIVERLMKEIRERGTFELLTKEIKRIGGPDREEEAEPRKVERLREAAVDHRGTTAETTIAGEEGRTRSPKELAETQRRREELKLIGDVESRYAAAWEKARCEQHSLRLGMEIEELEKRLKDYRVREKNENRVHDELTAFLTQRIVFTEGKIEEWRERHEREKEMYEKQIRSVRNEIEIRRKELEELREEYRSKQEFIDKYLAEKEALRREKEREEHMRRSATRIQAWWRGVMVRRKLGPYRPEEKKKKRSAKTQK